MTVDLQHFWGSNHFNHPPLTDEMVVAAEAALGVKLPDSLISLLRIQNGGYTAGFAHAMSQKTTWAEDHIPLEDLAGIVLDSDHTTAQNLLQTEYMVREWGLPERQVLLSGDGQYWVTLDYRNGPVPTVAWIDVESGEDMQVAQSFDAFLAGLVLASVYRDEA